MFNCLAKYLDNRVAGVSVTACIGHPFKSSSLWSLGKQYTGHGMGSLEILALKLLYIFGSLDLYLFATLLRTLLPFFLFSSKRAILIGETKKAIACSTDSRGVKESLSKVKEIFFANDILKNLLIA